MGDNKNRQLKFIAKTLVL